MKKHLKRLSGPLKNPIQLLYEYGPFVFFAVVLFKGALFPEFLYFDEIHYVPAAKAFFENGLTNLNPEHPPLAKMILGLGWKIFTLKWDIIPEPYVFRFITALFGLWSLWLVRAVSLELGLSRRLATAALWITGFSGTWIVLAHTAMLDTVYVAFGMLAILMALRNQVLGAGIALGTALACKWSAAIYLPLVVFSFAASAEGKRKAFFFVQRTFVALLFSGAAYFAAAFAAWLKFGKGPALEAILAAEKTTWVSQKALGAVSHPSISQPWEWPLLLHPIWLLFERQGHQVRGLWAGGSPFVYVLAFASFAYLLIYTFRSRARTPALLCSFYVAPLALWTVAPRALQFHYYFLPSTFWMGPLVVLGLSAWHRRRSKLALGLGETHVPRLLLYGTLAIAAAFFLYFLPLFDGRWIPESRLQSLLWLQSWR